MKPPFDLDRVIEAAARACHEANRAYCLALGDASQPAWDEAPAWQKDSGRMGIECVLKGQGPEHLHVSWMEEKLRAGWQYGPVKDAEAKTHPCLVPYVHLP